MISDKAKRYFSSKESEPKEIDDSLMSESDILSDYESHLPEECPIHGEECSEGCLMMSEGGEVESSPNDGPVSKEEAGKFARGAGFSSGGSVGLGSAIEHEKRMGAVRKMWRGGKS